MSRSDEEDKDHHRRSSSDRDRSRKRKHRDHGKDREKESRHHYRDRPKDSHKDKHRSRDRNKHEKKKDERGREKKKHEKKRINSKRSYCSSDEDAHRKNSHRERKHKSHRDSSTKRKKKYEKHSTTEAKKQKLSPKQSLDELGPLKNQPPSSLLDINNDYFAYHSHLRLYLYYHHQTYFEDLTSEKTRSHFSSFVKKYNKGLLPTIFYTPSGEIPSEILQKCKRTQHTWSFNTTKGESDTLTVVKEGVRKQTEYSGRGCTIIEPSSSKPDTIQSQIKREDPSSSYKKKQTTFDRRANKRLREHVQTTYEELTGISNKPTSSYERKIQYRNQQSEKQHGASLQLDELRMGGGVTELQDNDLYGDGSRDSFQKALAREKQRHQKKMGRTNARVHELQKKEDDRKKVMLNMLGLGHLQSGEKIKIAPRTDG